MKIPFIQPRTPLTLNKSQSEYIELLKKTILNSIYYPGPHVPEGKVWPECPALSMIGTKRLDNVQALVLDCLGKKVPGDFIEAGIWKGGVIALIAGLLKITTTQDRIVWGVDSFEGIPPAKPELYPADAAHIGCHTYEILKNNSQEDVIGYLDRLSLNSENRIKIIKGWFSDVLPTLSPQKTNFALVRVDGDTYESTIQCLENLEPRTNLGGYIVIDDYFSWTGCKQATDDYRAKKNIKEPLTTVDWTCVYWKKVKNTPSQH
ncbi:MAG: TylF/MycF/NovP-related O-methyltransferase [Opitutaceae bacterium]|jgi:hypothetical protein